MRIENISQFVSKPVQYSSRLETAFLEEMMKYIRPADSSNNFAGGIGEAQFLSFLNREYAEALASKLDINLKVDFDE